MNDRSATYATANVAVWTPCATSSMSTAIAAIASIAAKYARRKPRSSVSKRVAYAMYPCQATKTGMNSAAKRRNPPVE